MERMAREGVSEMQFLLGVLREQGFGMRADHAESEKWYRLAAAAGMPAAQYALFQFLAAELDKDSSDEQKEGVREWLRKSAAGGYAPAQLHLSGEVTDRDESIRLKIAAANQGYAMAAFLLGCLYSEGDKTVTPDPEQSFKWFVKAAELGHADAADRAATMLREGKGVPKDESAALKWYLKAYELGSPGAAGALSQIYGFGLLQQPKDAARAKRYSAEVPRLRRWWALSNGLLLEEPRPTLRSLIERIICRLFPSGPARH